MVTVVCAYKVGVGANNGRWKSGISGKSCGGAMEEVVSSGRVRMRVSGGCGGVGGEAGWVNGWVDRRN